MHGFGPIGQRLAAKSLSVVMASDYVFPTFTVVGPLTNAELRASPVNVAVVGTAAVEVVSPAPVYGSAGPLALEATLATRATEATLATRASAANQTTEIGHLASLVAKDFATQTTLAALNAKDFATQATLATRASEATLATLAAKDFATQTTLALMKTALDAVKAKTDNIDVLFSTRSAIASTQPVSAASLPLPTGATTEATLALVASRTNRIGHSNFADAVVNGNSYTAALLVGSVLAIPTAAIQTCVLYNPIGSGVNLVLLNSNVSLTGIPAATTSLVFAAALQAVAPTLATAVPVRRALLGTTGVNKGVLYSLATLSTVPSMLRSLYNVLVAGALATSTIVQSNIEGRIDGNIVLGPGAALCVSATTAASALASFTWEEVAV